MIAAALLSACGGSGTTIGEPAPGTSASGPTSTPTSSGTGHAMPTQTPSATPTPAQTPSGTATSTATSVPSTAPALQPGQVAVYETNESLSLALTRQANLAFSAGAGSQSSQITVTPGTTYQKLTAGFGVALTDTASWLLQTQLPPAIRDQAMAQLFSPTQGIGLSYVRVPMGGSDYNVSETGYTYDDVPVGQTDPTLAHFSMAHDRAYIIPALQEAKALNPNITFVSAPWSPPAWMKTDDSLVPTSPASTLLPQYYAVWAQYFVNFLQTYDAAGIHVDQMSIQNEPLNTLLFPGIPGMTLDPVDAATFVTSDLAPALTAAGYIGDIMAWDYTWEQDVPWVPPYLAIAQSTTATLGFHCYLSDPSTMTVYHAAYNLPEFETECASKLSEIEPEQMAIRSLRNYAQGILLWNAALDPSGGPKFGSGCAGVTGTTYAGQPCIAPVTVNPATGTYSLTSDFWDLAQFSKFVELGATRIDSTSADCPSSPVATPQQCGLEDVAFSNPDGTHVVVATSHNGSTQTFDVVENGKHFTATIPDGVTVTFVWHP